MDVFFEQQVHSIVPLQLPQEQIQLLQQLIQQEQQQGQR